jgi:Domain of unknown function (DUF6265)
VIKFNGMKKIILALVVLTVSAAFIFPDEVFDFRSLYALEGKWIMKTKRGTIGEEWVKVSKDHLQNRGFYVKGIDTTVTERVALKHMKDGIFYISTVEDQNNRQPVSFKLTSAKKNIFVFENDAHDFPKRIVYEIIKRDSIHAYIDGGAGNAGKRQDFYYKKVR